jgi:NAD(P)-dependent dehydrogenase (short-subunit alcohol dehydrogenase family)
VTAIGRRLHGRGAIVTGSSAGIGRAVALRLADEGAEILCCDLTPEPRPDGFDDLLGVPTDLAIRERGGRASFRECDAGDEASVEAAFAAADWLEAPLRICVLNAGVFSRDASILDETVEDHDETMRVNERGVWLGCRAAARRLVASGEGGRIVCIGSISGLVGLRGEPAYCASKGAVVNLVRAVALDLAAQRINVNAVCPGFVGTAMLRPALEDAAKRSELERLTPWPRLGRPSDVAAAVAFLASDDAAWITGVALPVDGGYTCR